MFTDKKLVQNLSRKQKKWFSVYWFYDTKRYKYMSIYILIN